MVLSEPNNIYDLEHLLFNRDSLPGQSEDLSDSQDSHTINNDFSTVSLTDATKVASSEQKPAPLPLFTVLDICRYLITKNLPIDLSFLFSCRISNTKEAKAFAYLMTNILDSPPFKIDVLGNRIKKLLDDRLLSDEDVRKYMENMLISKRK